jgi:hypothetical protein
LAAGTKTLPAALAGPELDLRLLVDHRERLVRTRVALNSTLQWNLHDRSPELTLPGGALFSKKWTTKAQSMADEVTRWGVVTCGSHEPPAARRQRMIRLEKAAEAAGVLVSTEPGDDRAPKSITIRWSARDDLNAASSRILDQVGIHPADWENGPKKVA